MLKLVTIEACEMKVGKYSQINEYMTIYDNTRTRSFIDRFQTSFPKKNTRPFEAKFHTEPQWDVGIKICSYVSGHMTKMASMPIYGKKRQKIFFFGTKRPMILKLDIQYQVLRYYQICLNYDTRLTLAMVKFFPNAFA